MSNAEIAQQVLTAEQKEIIAGLNFLTETESLEAAVAGAKRVIAAIDEDRLYGGRYWLPQEGEYEDEDGDEIDYPQCACYYGHLLAWGDQSENPNNFLANLIKYAGDFIVKDERGFTNSLTLVEKMVVNITPDENRDYKFQAGKVIKETIENWLREKGV